MEKINNHKITIESYDTTANEYFKTVSNFEVLPEFDIFMGLVKQNGKILDLGCGPGHHTKLLYEHGFDVTGIDLSTKMIGIAKKNFPTLNFKVMDITNLDFSHNTFDGIWASASLLHISKNQIKTVLSNIYNILDANGHLYLSLKKGKGSKIVKDYRYGGVNKFYVFYKKHEILKLLINEGFSEIKILERDKRDYYDTNNWIHIFCQKR